MARPKVHKAIDISPAVADPMAGPTPLCRQGHRKLLPLELAADWRAVTCAKCLRHRPRVTRMARLLAFFGGMLGGKGNGHVPV